ncbi:MAG: SDR family oxidoreductase [Candidatus Latescibacterota bacterium]|nr:MAG: SDR family oxidoreductase [Candidatus Latescibacterota bacterium]
MIDLSGRAALVTGGSRGIGAATCRLLAEAGADVAVHFGSAREAAESVAASVERAGRRALVEQADLRVAVEVETLAARAHAGLGRLDILVHNAGVWTHAPLETLAPEIWQDTMCINLDAVYRLTRAALPLLRQSEHASIVNVASTAAQRGEAEHAHYAASKGAVISWTKSLAVELAPVIRVNAVAPGWVETDMVLPALYPPGRREAIEREIPRGCVARPADVAGAILFLSSDLAAHITGEVLNVNGGSVRCG